MSSLPPLGAGDAAGEIDVGDGTWTEDLKNRFADRIVNLLGRLFRPLPLMGLASLRSRPSLSHR
jgi:hypothetical protein